jgi:hypothetical protein
MDMREQFFAEMGAWVRDGKIKWEETVDNGVENAPKAFLNLFSGGNTEKDALVQLVLEEQNLAADRRLRHVQLSTGARKGPGLGDGLDDLELAQIHRTDDI